MAIGTTGALLAGTIGSSVVGAVSAGKAASAQAEAADAANETQRYIFDRSVELTEPAREIGHNALAAMAYELGIGPQPTYNALATASGGGDIPAGMEIREMGGTRGAMPNWYLQNYSEPSRARAAWEMTAPMEPGYFLVGDQRFNTRDAAQSYVDQFRTPAEGAPEETSYGGFTATPGYEFRMSEGLKALERGAAARGVRMGSDTLLAVSAAATARFMPAASASRSSAVIWRAMRSTSICNARSSRTPRRLARSRSCTMPWNSQAFTGLVAASAFHAA